MEVYLEAGACARLLHDIGTKTAVVMSQILPAKDSDRLVVLLNRIDEIKSKAEDQLFRDHPQIGYKARDVFYGTLKEKPQSEMDEEVIAKAKKKAGELFGSL